MLLRQWVLLGIGLAVVWVGSVMLRDFVRFCWNKERDGLVLLYVGALIGLVIFMVLLGNLEFHYIR